MATTALVTEPVSGALLLPRFLSLVSPNMKRVDPKLHPFAESALAQADQELSPATRDDFRQQLTACLTLVAPTGMTQDDRNEWLKAAWGTLDGIPADLLASGATAARQWADHPAKVVPAILREIEAIWAKRRANRGAVVEAMGKMEEPKQLEEPRCTAGEAAAIIKRVGLNMRAG